MDQTDFLHGCRGETDRFFVAGDDEVSAVLDRDVGEFEQRALSFWCIKFDSVEEGCAAQAGSRPEEALA